MPSNRAAILTPSPIRSPSLSSTTSPKVNANAEDNASVLRQTGVALDHGVLHFDGAAHGVDHAAEFDQSSIAGALYDTTVVHGDRRVDEIAAERPEAGKSAILVRAGEPAEADDVGSQDRCKFAGFGHRAPFAEFEQHDDRSESPFSANKKE